MHLPLFIPWFKAEPVYIPLPFDLPLLPNGLPIQPFGVLVAIGVLLGLRLAEEFAKRNGIREDAAYDFSMYAILPGFAGAFLLNVVFYQPETILRAFQDPKALLSWHGLSSYGGFFGTAFGVYLWKRKYRLPVLNIADTTAFAFPFGWAFGRMGCFVVHDHPGRVTDFPFAVADYVTPYGRPPFPARHDLGLYEVFWSVAVAALFLVMWRTPRRPPGIYLALIITLYAPIRFLLDFLRAEDAEGGDRRYLGLTPGHYSSLVFLAIGLYLVRRILTGDYTAIPESLVAGADGSAAGETAPSAPEPNPEPDAPAVQKDAHRASAGGKGRKKRR